MNTNTHRNGCHNRADFVDKRIVQDGCFEYSLTVKVVSIPNFSAREPCQYTLSRLGQADQGCTGCTWRKGETS
jgi:hypothetical protein